ncbi:uncharacterized protein LOC130405474 [Gadus chalcogrammus]|uniref:uncharacterized protein LOC130405474 n=1 Tax=Gadus chalcogrammus TaxID=1042646 RepID=UPI0024C4C167|nr:uncharacterized protein LOC130405474 [Gadus chalcogrammus]
MDADVCAGALLSLISVHQAKQLQQDNRAETRRRTRSKQRVAARRVRLHKLRQEWKQRTTQLRRARMERFEAHRIWMEGMALQYLKQCSPWTPRVWSYPRPNAWWETTATGFTDHQWLQHFRVSWVTFSFLCGALRRRLKRQDTTYRLCIPLSKRVALALYKLGNPCSYKTVAELFAVGVASVCHCVRDFCSAVIEVLRPQLVAEPTPGDLRETAERFYLAHGVPRCVGVIGRILVPIVRPPHHRADPPGGGEGWRLVVSLQAVVDGDGRFWEVNVGDPEWAPAAAAAVAGEGSVGSGLWPWAREDFPDRMQTLLGDEEGGLCLLADDEALPARPWLLRPHRTSAWLTADQELFNAQVLPARRAARQALARLKGRWRCLDRRLDCTVEVVRDMARACCVLHNLCERNADAFLPEWAEAEGDPRWPDADKSHTDLDSTPPWLALQPLEDEGL